LVSGELSVLFAGLNQAGEVVCWRG